MRVASQPWLLSVALFGASACHVATGSRVPAATELADTVLVGGRIHRDGGDAARSQMLAIANGRIVHIGPREDADAWIGPETRVGRLDGRVVLPGFHSPHVHPVNAGYSLRGCPLYDSYESLDHVLNTVEECARERPGDAWIVGQGWYMDLFELGLPTREMLDRIAPDRPVALLSGDIHTLWVNSRALELAGITTNTPDPPGGRIDRDSDGVPTGTLHEDAATDLIFAVVGPPSDAELEASLAAAQAHLHAHGVTAIQDAKIRVDGPTEFRSLDAYAALRDRGELTLRVVGNLFWDNQRDVHEQVARFEQLRSRYSGGRFQVRSVKIWLDGVNETETAALREAYLTNPDSTGALGLDVDALTEIVDSLEEHGFQLHVHAMGDRAVQTVLDAFERAARLRGGLEQRHHLSHLMVVSPADVARFAALGVTANFQPLWAYRDAYVETLTVPRLGAERVDRLYPIGDFVRAGARVAFSSDWAVSSANPFEGLEVAVTRRDPYGTSTEPLGEAQAISLRAALEAYTSAGAYLNFQDDETGTLEVGKLADLVIVDRDPFAVDPSGISEVKVVTTMVEGEVVFGSLKLD